LEWDEYIIRANRFIEFCSRKDNPLKPCGAYGPPAKTSCEKPCPRYAVSVRVVSCAQALWEQIMCEATWGRNDGHR
jgi:hypothetical protein